LTAEIGDTSPKFEFKRAINPIVFNPFVAKEDVVLSSEKGVERLDALAL
jgi:hypothetical protein